MLCNCVFLCILRPNLFVNLLSSSNYTAIEEQKKIGETVLSFLGMEHSLLRLESGFSLHSIFSLSISDGQMRPHGACGTFPKLCRRCVGSVSFRVTSARLKKSLQANSMKTGN